MSTSRTDQPSLLFLDYRFGVSLFATDPSIEDANARQHRDAFARRSRR